VLEYDKSRLWCTVCFFLVIFLFDADMERIVAS
jgi:hypothetical protein